MTANRTGRATSEAGFTLVELLIAMAIALVVATAVFGLFLQQTRAMRGQQQVAEVQDNARIALDMLARDIRNSGFLTAPGGSLRIENDCALTNLSFAAPATWQIGGGNGTAVVTNGNDLFTAWGNGSQTSAVNGNDACPNASDRITLVSRPRSDTVTGCNALGCAIQNGLGNDYSVPCEPCNGGPCTDATAQAQACGLTMEKVCPGCSVACQSGSNYTFPAPKPHLSICHDADPTKCVDVELDKAHCSTNAQGLPNGNAVQLSWQFPGTNSFSGQDWDLVGGKDVGISVGGITHRTWQILDLDGDGSPELVYSDKVSGMDAASAGGSPAQDPQWVVAAYGIEDLEFAYALKNTPTVFVNDRSLWELPGCTANTTRDCLQALAAAGNPPVALRVTIVARAQKAEVGADDRALAGGRPAVENNLGDPNAKGFRRRVLTTVIGLRNFANSSGT